MGGSLYYSLPQFTLLAHIWDIKHLALGLRWKLKGKSATALWIREEGEN